MSNIDITDICSPIKKLNDVLNWKCDEKCWIHKHKVGTIRKRAEYVSPGNALDLRKNNEVYPEFKFPCKVLPKTIFCHDYKGGYISDKLCSGSPDVATYRFFNWAAIDMFIYFSHHLVTIPPYGWTKAGHLHGVPVLGTLITEWTDGKNIWEEILVDKEKIELFSKNLAKICAHYQFDGYLLNVENEIAKELVPQLIHFIVLLKSHLKLYCDGPTWLIWYDSVTTEGCLNWQNKLCTLNKPFFDACDGIFLNYVWTPADLLESIDVAGPRKFDVFVGIDVWGRNCYQDGGFNTDKALAMVYSLRMSVALFGLGWTEETLPPGEDFLTRELSFWKMLSPYLFIHGPSSLPFRTNFSHGVSYNKNTGDSWFNLGTQNPQLTLHSCSASPKECDSCIALYLQDGLNSNGDCLKITAASRDHSKKFHRVLSCDFAGKTDAASTMMVRLVLKNCPSDLAPSFRVYFVLEDRKGIEGKQRFNIKKQPNGYRTSKVVAELRISGSVIDFTHEENKVDDKINILGSELNDEWISLTFGINLSASTSLTEVLLLPPSKGSVLWGFLAIDKL